MSEESKISLFLNNNTAYIWTCEDWSKTRSNRVIGNFVGNLAALPRQEFSEGLPLTLLPEEATLLVEKDLALFKEVPSLSERPSTHVRQQQKLFRDEILKEEAKLLKSLRKRELEKNIHKILEGKRKKLMLKATNQKKQIDDSDSLDEKLLQEEYDRIENPKTSSLSVQIFTSDPWIEAESLRRCDWHYPTTGEEKLRYRTYKDLWERGFYVTSGKKFGADYLVYPGDPVRFHSFFFVVCINKNHELMPNEIITYGRLGQSVRKTFILAYLNSDETINFQSIQWMG